jgi:hypothetical protein
MSKRSISSLPLEDTDTASIPVSKKSKELEV